MMKKVIIILLIILTAQSAFAKGYDMSVPLEGDSIASDDLQTQVLKELYSIISKKNAYCFDYSIKNTQLLQYPYDVKKKNGKYIKGYWKELWSVNMCEKNIQVPVNFEIKGKNTVFNFEGLNN